ncbi:hypothetical protein FDG2_6336 [Candidatus Protofrankia californiensis]|uniref:Uncharacterized protein n=1 Tax=Candidatus Protofrankia californiensis TaxID=1839754 RepID=A0A1C3PGS1_9ACTN|nr:hypothetical protein FDG2_6336 [Candidatus Protofrankia californiensis]
MSRPRKDSPLRKGDRVTSTEWPDIHGRVTRVDDDGSVFVRWDGTHFEDERDRDQVTRTD